MSAYLMAVNTRSRLLTFKLYFRLKQRCPPRLRTGFPPNNRRWSDPKFCFSPAHRLPLMKTNHSLVYYFISTDSIINVSRNYTGCMRNPYTRTHGRMRITGSRRTHKREIIAFICTYLYYIIQNDSTRIITPLPFNFFFR